MTPEELKLFEEKQTEQEKIASSFNRDLCQQMQADLEAKYALYVLRKQTVPFTRWYLENIKDSTIQVEINKGDQIDHIELEQSFSIKNEYKGTIRSTVLDITPTYIKLMTPEGSNFLITENTKVNTIIKPLYEKEFDVQERMMNLLEAQSSKKLTFDQIKTLVIISSSIISVLIFIAFMIF